VYRSFREIPIQYEPSRVAVWHRLRVLKDNYQSKTKQRVERRVSTYLSVPSY